MARIAGAMEASTRQVQFNFILHRVRNISNFYTRKLFPVTTFGLSHFRMVSYLSLFLNFEICNFSKHFELNFYWILKVCICHLCKYFQHSKILVNEYWILSVDIEFHLSPSEGGGQLTQPSPSTQTGGRSLSPLVSTAPEWVNHHTRGCSQNTWPANSTWYSGVMQYGMHFKPF